jgi:hypothetical protein
MTGYEAGITLNGKLIHRRTINSKYGTSDLDWLRQGIDASAYRYEGKPKFKYLLPLDDQIAERIKLLSKPYPNAPQAKRTLRLDPIQEGAGVNPTVALHNLQLLFASASCSEPYYGLSEAA